MARRKHLKSLELCVNFDICESPERLKVPYCVQVLKAAVLSVFQNKPKVLECVPTLTFGCQPVPTSAAFL